MLVTVHLRIIKTVCKKFNPIRFFLIGFYFYIRIVANGFQLTEGGELTE